MVDRSEGKKTVADCPCKERRRKGVNGQRWVWTERGRDEDDGNVDGGRCGW